MVGIDGKGGYSSGLAPKKVSRKKGVGVTMKSRKNV